MLRPTTSVCTPTQYSDNAVDEVERSTFQDSAIELCRLEPTAGRPRLARTTLGPLRPARLSLLPRHHRTGSLAATRTTAIHTAPRQADQWSLATEGA